MESSDLVGLLAIRLTYDLALATCKSRELWECAWPVKEDMKPTSRLTIVDEIARYVGLVAAENCFRMSLASQLTDQEKVIDSEPIESRHQLIFCIDVRSEVIRRAVESVSSDIETFGFAGFFGLPFRDETQGIDMARSQCPVLLEPSFTVREEHHGNGSVMDRSTADKKKRTYLLKYIWKKFRQSAISCFAYVETLGILYLPNLLRSTLVSESRKRQTSLASTLPVVETTQASCLHVDLSITEKGDYAERIFKSLGLANRLGRLVVFVGHTSMTTNNPYQASLDCGACGGHSGEPNAKLAANWFNAPLVREELKKRGIEIPDNTWFVAGVHNTTTDEIKLIAESQRPSWVDDELRILEKHLEQGGKAARQERMLRFDMSSEFSPFRNAADWSEVRAEWGLVNNAAFIAAPRARTRGLRLSGRTFLHSYDEASDEEGTVLEMILTAPVVVAHWINSQYYFSSVDPDAFGSGNKVLHNVVGRLGIVEGNSGDLQTGLPWQSVHDGEQLRHEPLRLTVIVDAEPAAVDAVVAKHDLLRNLVENRWVRLVAWRGNALLDRRGVGEWHACEEAAAASR